MNVSKKLYKKGLEKFLISWIIGQNLFFIFYFTMAFIGMHPLQICRIPIVSLLFVIFSLKKLQIHLEHGPKLQVMVYFT